MARFGLFLSTGGIVLSLHYKNHSIGSLYGQGIITLGIVRQDPQLGLPKLRIELEKALISLYTLQEPGRNTRQSLGLPRLVDQLYQRGDVSAVLAAALRDIIPLANRAVHGEYVRTQDAEDLALLGIRVLEELRSLYMAKVLAPSESTVIEHEELARLMSSRYRVTTAIPLVDEPRKNVYVLDQEELDNLLEGYNEYAEFIVSVEPLTPEEEGNS